MFKVLVPGTCVFLIYFYLFTTSLEIKNYDDETGKPNYDSNLTSEIRISSCRSPKFRTLSTGKWSISIFYQDIK